MIVTVGSQIGLKKVFNMLRSSGYMVSKKRARWKTKQLEKDYNMLKRQFDNIKANNDVLKNHNKKLHERRLGRGHGLVIDLTNNDRHRWKSDWTQEGIQYVKIKWLYGLKKRARWKKKQLEKDYNVLKRQFDNIKANNDVLKNHNKKLHVLDLAIITSSM
uniref:Homeobox-leucine zipper protein n=1 Tax=Tanacetum cinerariifolium TaxID=118510 RepID=A0A6L2M8N7_TANCI|nr:leucine zipper, homeobox-associated, homeodomain-like protein [Tanacetum cinerariifolium]